MIRERGRALIDGINGKSTLIYIDPETSNPAAMVVNAKTAKLDGSEIRLDNGSVVCSGVLVDRGGKSLDADRPQQMFTRWYGFALTFPNAEIFSQPWRPIASTHTRAEFGFRLPTTELHSKPRWTSRS